MLFDARGAREARNPQGNKCVFEFPARRLTAGCGVASRKCMKTNGFQRFPFPPRWGIFGNCMKRNGFSTIFTCSGNDGNPQGNKGFLIFLAGGGIPGCREWRKHTGEQRCFDSFCWRRVCCSTGGERGRRETHRETKVFFEFPARRLTASCGVASRKCMKTLFSAVSVFAVLRDFRKMHETYCVFNYFQLVWK